MKFRKKPVVIEAYQYTQTGDNYRPDWFQSRVTTRTIDTYPDHFMVQTLEGAMRGDIGDWCIKGIKGEVYPCRADIFEATYEPVEDAKT